MLKLTMLLVLGGSGVLPSFSQSNVYSLNIVGYINRAIVPGDNLIGNQLNYAPLNGPVDNSLNHILLSVADGTTFTKWDAGANAFLPLSVFDLNSQTWSINYSLNLGEGALVHSPARTTNTFVGSVMVYTNIVSAMDLGPGSPWAPNYAAGLHLLACPMPVGGSVSSMFAKVVGRAPATGEWVKVLDEANQTYLTSTFDGASWDHDPDLAVAHAAWFNLGPVTVPEPSALALSAGAGLVLAGARRRRR